MSEGPISRSNRGRGSLVAGTGLIAFDHIISEDGTAVSALGGSCGNVLTSLGLLGYRVAPIARLGIDQVGDYLVEELRNAHCRTDLVSRVVGLLSPVVFEHVDTSTAIHSFDFLGSSAPASRSRWISITSHDLLHARETIQTARVFYADRVSGAIVEAMEDARQAGAIVYFEPSSRKDGELFARAAAASTILKVSGDRLGLRELPKSSGVTIFTRGSRGMMLRLDDQVWECPPVPVERLVDTCGAGDMVTVGVLHALLANDGGVGVDLLKEGMMLGARLASLNCAFVGARGMFLALGEELLQEGIERDFDERFVRRALLLDPFVGYRHRVTQRLHA